MIEDKIKRDKVASRKASPRDRKAQSNKGTLAHPVKLRHGTGRGKGTQAHRSYGTKMLFFLFCLLVTGHWTLVTEVHAADDIAAVVERIQKKYSEILDIQGAFVQTSHLKDLDRTEKYAGTFSLKKPSRIRWQYRAPRDEEVLISGDKIWIYNKSENQVMKSGFSRDAYSQVPIALLESLGDMKADYEIRMTAEDMLELTPRQQMGFIKHMRLITGSGDFPVRSLAIFDLYGNSNIIELKDVKINSGIKDSLFTFKMPPGAELFDYSQ